VSTNVVNSVTGGNSLLSIGGNSKYSRSNGGGGNSKKYRFTRLPTMLQEPLLKDTAAE
jgi:hypothetical protein